MAGEPAIRTRPLAGPGFLIAHRVAFAAALVGPVKVPGPSTKGLNAMGVGIAPSRRQPPEVVAACRFGASRRWPRGACLDRSTWDRTDTSVPPTKLPGRPHAENRQPCCGAAAIPEASVSGDGQRNPDDLPDKPATAFARERTRAERRPYGGGHELTDHRRSLERRAPRNGDLGSAAERFLPRRGRKTRPVALDYGSSDLESLG